MMGVSYFLICILFLFGKNRMLCFNAHIWLNSRYPSIKAKLLYDENISDTKHLFTIGLIFRIAFTASILEIMNSTHVVSVGSEQGQMEYNTQLLPFLIFFN